MKAKMLTVIALSCLMASCAVSTKVMLPDGETCTFKSQRDAVLSVETPEGFKFSADLTGNPPIIKQVAALIGGAVIGTGKDINIGE